MCNVTLADRNETSGMVDRDDVRTFCRSSVDRPLNEKSIIIGLLFSVSLLVEAMENGNIHGQ